jgi:hypothetical protein
MIPQALEPRRGSLQDGDVCYIDEVRITLQGMSTAGAFSRGLRRFASISNPALRLPEPTRPEPAELWVTNQRFIVHSLKKGEEEIWVQIPYGQISRSWLEHDGAVFFDMELGQPFKISFPFAAWMFVLYKWLAGGVIIDVELPRGLQGFPLIPSVAYPDTQLNAPPAPSAPAPTDPRDRDTI